jgi:hypothetical protein
MYSNKTTSAAFDIMNYIEGADVFNSSFIYELNKIKDYNTYKYSTLFNKGRLDLITETIYGSANYIGVLSVYNRLNPNDLEYGIINYPSMDLVESTIVNSIVNAL